jgi:hypothetical protein
MISSILRKIKTLNNFFYLSCQCTRVMYLCLTKKDIKAVQTTHYIKIILTTFKTSSKIKSDSNEIYLFGY